MKDRYKNITLLGPAVPAAETWWQDGADRWAHQDDDSAGFREDDLYTRPTAAIVATIPVIVSLVCTTNIDSMTGPDGHELSRGVERAELDLGGRPSRAARGSRPDHRGDS